MQILEAWIAARSDNPRLRDLAAAYPTDEVASDAIHDALQEEGIDMSLPGFKEGDNVFIRTCTLYYIGKIKLLTPSFVLLEQVTWVAQTAHWGETLRNGSLREHANMPDDAAISLWSVIDCTKWRHKLHPPENLQRD
jgi:hypothetical protein